MISGSHSTTNRRWRFLKEAIIIAVILIPFCFWVVKRYLFLDFWYDEIFTFDCFIFVPFKKTVTDYGAPNNHIFFNILSSIYLRLLGIKNLFVLMDMPYKIRLFPFTTTLLTFVYIYRIGQKFLNRFTTYIALIILATTIPFYNFAVQVRGYSLSTLFVTMCVYHAWSFEKTAKRRDAVGLLVLGVLALYAIPLNLYFLGSVAIFYIGTGIHQLIKKGQVLNIRDLVKGKTVYETSMLVIFGIICIAIMIAGLIYLPFYDSLVNNRHFKSHGLFNATTLLDVMPHTLLYFFSQRYLFIPITCIGIVCGVLSIMRKKEQEIVYRGGFCAFILCMPFVLSFIRGDHPPYRAFANLTPIFSLFVALCTYLVIASLPKFRTGHILIVWGLVIYAHVTFGWAISHITNRLKADIVQGQKSQNIYYNYYQAYYEPMKLVQEFHRNYDLDSIPVTIFRFGPEETEIRRYLEKFHIEYYELPGVIATNSQGQAYISTVFPEKFIALMKQQSPRSSCKYLNHEPNFHNILYCESL